MAHWMATVTVCRNLPITALMKQKHETRVFSNINYKTQHGCLPKNYKHDTSDKSNMQSVFILELRDK